MKKLNFQDIKGEILQNLNKISQDRNKLILTVIIIFIFIILDFSFGLKAQIKAIKTINPKIINLAKGFQNIEADLIKMQRQGEGKTVVAKDVVPADKQAWLIEEISGLANDQDVNISLVRPVKEAQVTDVVPGQQPPRAEQHAVLMIDLEAVAEYHQLGKFLAALENHSIFLQVTKLSIKRSVEKQFKRDIKLRLKTYVGK